MGRPRGKGNKSAEAADNDGGSSAGEEAAPTAHKRSGTGSPQKPREDNETDKVEDGAEVEEVEDGVKPIVPTKGPKSTTAESNGEIKRPRRRRRRPQVERSSESVEGGDDARAKPSGFRRNGSRRKNSTPRRAA